MKKLPNSFAIYNTNSSNISVRQIREDNSDKNHDGPNDINDGVPRLVGVLPLVVPSVVARVEPLPFPNPETLLALARILSEVVVAELY